MIVATTENIAGHRTLETRGQCFGVIVRSRGIGGNFVAGLHYQPATGERAYVVETTVA